MRSLPGAGRIFRLPRTLRLARIVGLTQIRQTTELATAAAHPGAAHLLVPEAESEPVPAVYRAGRRLAAEDLVSTGDVLDLVLAIAGG